MDISSLDAEQLLTAAAFISYLLYQNQRLIGKIEKAEAEKAALYERYIERVSSNSADLMEATRVFDRLTQANK